MKTGNYHAASEGCLNFCIRLYVCVCVHVFACMSEYEHVSLLMRGGYNHKAHTSKRLSPSVRRRSAASSGFPGQDLTNKTRVNHPRNSVAALSRLLFKTALVWRGFQHPLTSILGKELGCNTQRIISLFAVTRNLHLHTCL